MFFFFLPHPQILISVSPYVGLDSVCLGVLELPMLKLLTQFIFLSCKCPYKALYGFSGAAVTKYHKQMLKTPEIDCFSVLEARSLKSRRQQGHHPSESCKRESFLASVSLGCCRKTLIFLGL